MSRVMHMEHGISKINTYHLCITFQMATHNSYQILLTWCKWNDLFHKREFCGCELELVFSQSDGSFDQAHFEKICWKHQFNNKNSWIVVLGTWANSTFAQCLLKNVISNQVGNKLEIPNILFIWW
jgi:hypothetical protein